MAWINTAMEMAKRGLNKAQLQIMAVIAMVMDHTAIFLIPHMKLYYTFHLLGRITIVIMSYFVAEGYYKTRNVNKYIIRMGIFAAAAQIPFYLYDKMGRFGDIKNFIIGNFYAGNVIFTLFAGLCLLAIIKSELHLILKALAAFAAWALTRHSDWGIYCLLWVIGFGLLHDRCKLQMRWAEAVVLFKVIMELAPLALAISQGASVTRHSVIMAFVQLGGLLAIIPLMLYNGEKGNAPRLGFYIFYPAHLLVLAVIMRILY